MRFFTFLFLCLLSVEVWGLPRELYVNPVPRSELDAKPTWDNFQKVIIEQKKRNEQEGLAYVISGGIAFVGGIVGYQRSNDLFAKGAYALSQSLGVAAVGYGAHESLIGSQERLIYDTLNADHFLNPAQRDQFVKIYFDLEAKKNRETQRIAALTHGLLAGLNLYNGVQATHEDLRSTLYFIAVINVIACVTYSF